MPYYLAITKKVKPEPFNVCVFLDTLEAKNILHARFLFLSRVKEKPYKCINWLQVKAIPEVNWSENIEKKVWK